MARLFFPSLAQIASAIWSSSSRTLTSSTSVVNSVQFGTIAFGASESTKTATITAVSSKAALFHLGQSAVAGASDAAGIIARITLTNSTTVTGTRDATGGVTCTVSFCVVDFA